MKKRDYQFDWLKASDELHAIARRSPSKVALIDGVSGREWCYGELDTTLDRVAHYLKVAINGKSGSLVTILPNSIDAVLLFLGCIRAGVDFAPLTPQATQRDLASWLELVKPALIIHSPVVAPLLSKFDGISNFPTLEIIANGELGWLEVAHVQPQHPLRSSLMFLYTSGTTGAPKALTFDCDRLWTSGREFLRQHDFIDTTSRFWNILPMSYLGGTFNLTMLPLSVGGSTVISDTFSGKSFIGFWSNIERFGINTLWLVPAIVRGLLPLDKVGTNKSRSNVRASFLGTASIDTETKRKFESIFGFPLLENFALSETTFLTSETLGSRLRKTGAGVGHPLPYVNVQLRRDPEQHEGIGEIEISSPFVFEGYLQPNGQVENPATEDGFFRTGDIGRFDADGDLVHLGRTRDIIKKGGYFVMLTEIERVALEHEFVREAAAVPVVHPFYGEDSALALILKADVPEDAVVKIRNYVQANLPAYKWPSKFEVFDDFPRTASGKVRKAILADDLGKRHQ